LPDKEGVPKTSNGVYKILQNCCEEFGSTTISRHIIHKLAFLLLLAKTSKLYNILGEFLFLNPQRYYNSPIAVRYLGRKRTSSDNHSSLNGP